MIITSNYVFIYKIIAYTFALIASVFCQVVSISHCTDASYKFYLMTMGSLHNPQCFLLQQASGLGGSLISRAKWQVLEWTSINTLCLRRSIQPGIRETYCIFRFRLSHM